VADLYIVVFNAALYNPQSIKHGREGYFFGENGEHMLVDVYRSVAQVLYALGKAESPEPTKFTDEELAKYQVRAARIVVYDVLFSFSHTPSAAGY